MARRTKTILRMRAMQRNGYSDAEIVAATGCTPEELTAPKGKPSPYKRRKLSSEEKRRIRERCNNRCVFCGCADSRKLDFDHIVPVSKGGTNDESNFQLACELCNMSKGNREYPSYLRKK